MITKLLFLSPNEHEIHKMRFESCANESIPTVINGNGNNNSTDNNNKNTTPSHFGVTRALSLKTLYGRRVKIPFDIEDIRKGDYPHFMLKEIYDQPHSIQNTIGSKLKHLDMIHVDVPSDLKSVTFLACGTSYHAGLIGSYIIENLIGIPVFVQYASEYINKRCLLNGNDLAIAISQSGETADTREALKKTIDHGAKVAGIINVVGSQIARMAGRGMYLHAGPEIGVASTKAFSCQVAAINLLAAFLINKVTHTTTKRTFTTNSTVNNGGKNTNGNSTEHELTAMRVKILESLSKVPSVVKSVLENQEMHETIDRIAETYYQSKNALYLGRGIDWPVALEGALKLKEISYIHAEGYASGEMKHGPIALIDENMPVFFVVGARDGNYGKVLSNMEEVKARKGRIITISDFVDSRLYQLSEFVIVVPHISESVSPIIKVIPLQLIAYRIAVKKKGLDPDRPRNLAKSVTVI